MFQYPYLISTGIYQVCVCYWTHHYTTSINELQSLCVNNEIFLKTLNVDMIIMLNSIKYTNMHLMNTNVY